MAVLVAVIVIKSVHRVVGYFVSHLVFCIS